MLAIKLKPVGRKSQITYRVVVAEKRSKLKGKYIEDVGWLNPYQKEFKINRARVEYWLKTGGAQPTDTVYNLLVKAGVIKGPKRAVHATKKEAPASAKATAGKKEKPKMEKKAPEGVVEDKNETKEKAPEGVVENEDKAEETPEENSETKEAPEKTSEKPVENKTETKEEPSDQEVTEDREIPEDEKKEEKKDSSKKEPEKEK